jgi:hypothetical protein
VSLLLIAIVVAAGALVGIGAYRRLSATPLGGAARGTMRPLPASASDEDLVRFIDGWAALMEREDYAAAFAYTNHLPVMRWTPDLIREVVKGYDEARPEQRVTVAGVPSDVTQRKEVTRWTRNRYGESGEIWYDLNIDGVASDLTATFRIVESRNGITIYLNDIHVM